MTDWIDFFVYAAFLISMWFVQPVAQQRLALPVLKDRNPDWVAANPQAIEALRRTRWRIWLSWALGAISLAALTAFQTGLWQVPPPPPGAPPLKEWLVLWNLAMASMLVGIVIGGAIGIYGHIQLKRHIPVGPRRQATLERRSLDDFVPRWVQYLTHALVLANIAAWGVAAALGTHSTPIFWSRVVTLLFLSAVFFFATRATVMRRGNVMDRIFGAGYRRWEARYIFSMQFTTPLIGAMRLYEEVNHTMLFDMNRAMQLLLALFITYGLLRVSLLPLDPAERTPTPVGTPAPQS